MIQQDHKICLKIVGTRVSQECYLCCWLPGGQLLEACELSTGGSYLVWSSSRRCDCHTSSVVQRPSLVAIGKARKIPHPWKTFGSSCGLAVTPRVLTVWSNHKRSLVLKTNKHILTHSLRQTTIKILQYLVHDLIFLYIL